VSGYGQFLVAAVTVSLCGNSSPELGLPPEIADRTTAGHMVGRADAFKTDFARSLRPASMARCTGSSGGFASYLRDPLLGTYREKGLVIMSAQSSAHAGWTRTLVAEP
jgi:hypothetical protein